MTDSRLKQRVDVLMRELEHKDVLFTRLAKEAVSTQAQVTYTEVASAYRDAIKGLATALDEGP